MVHGENEIKNYESFVTVVDNDNWEVIWWKISWWVFFEITWSGLTKSSLAIRCGVGLAFGHNDPKILSVVWFEGVFQEMVKFDQKSRFGLNYKKISQIWSNLNRWNQSWTEQPEIGRVVKPKLVDSKLVTIRWD